MSPKLRLYRHQWEPTGSGDAKSIQNAMGKTSLDLWSLLLRESLQNSWDARLGDHIRFTIADTLLSPSESSALVHEVFGELPPQGASRNLPKKLTQGRLRVLTIADYGTRGLGGPLRANFASKEGEKRDFVDLVRNFGRSQDKGLEGGTYGLGKGVLYSSSQVGMCLIYSQALVHGAVENRLIGVSGGDPDYDDGNLKYTGRNWWGVIADDGIVDPVIGPEARHIAESIGIPVPEPEETGTCIMVLAPKDIDELGNAGEPQDRIGAIRDAAVLWAWPHALDLGDGPDVSFEFSYEGTILDPIKPLEEPLVRHFARGYQDMMRSRSSGREPASAQTILRSIDSQRPSKHLGALVLRQELHQLGDDRTLENTVALLRKPKMVVKYLPVTAPVGDYSVYSVFYADKSVDKYLASSEPVAHDDWVIKDAKRDGVRNYVRTILNKIDETFKSLYSASAAATASQRVAGATKISSALGGIIMGIKGQGAEVQNSRLGVKSSGTAINATSRRATIRPSGPPQLFKFKGEHHVAFPFIVNGGRIGEKFFATAKAQIVLGTGGVEAVDGPAGSPNKESHNAPFWSDGPEFLGWSVDGEGKLVQSLIVATPSDQTYLAIFTQPADTAISSIAALDAIDK